MRRLLLQLSFLVFFVPACAHTCFGQAGLISHFTFDGTLANEVGDVAAGELMGGASFVNGALGQAIELDGVDDWIDTTTTGEPAGETLFESTVAFWIRLADEAPTDNIQFFGNLNSAPDSTALLVGTNGASGLQIFPRAVSGNDYVVRTASETGDVFAPDLSWADGEWHHLAFSWSIGFENEAAIYIDGEPQNLNVRTNTLTTSDDFAAWENPSSIGARNNRGELDSFVAGRIDDFRVYNLLLDPEDIAELAAVEIDTFECDPNTLGDADGDGDVAFSDFLILSENFGQAINDHTAGDFDCNGDVAFSDFLILSDNFGTTVGAQPVPEPSGFAIIATILLLIVPFRQRR